MVDVSGTSDWYPCLLDSPHGEISGLVTIFYYQLHIKPAKTAPLVISTLMVIIFTFLMGQPPPPPLSSTSYEMYWGLIPSM